MQSEITTEQLASLETAQKWRDLFSAAIKYLTQESSEKAIGFYYQGISQHELKIYQEAEASLNKAIEIDDKNALYYNSRGLLYKDQRKYPEAIKEFSNSINMNPDFLNPQINKAQTLSLQNKHDQALIIYNSILSKNPNLIPVLIFKAECLKDLGLYDEAHVTYDSALKIEPDAVDLIFNNGNIYAQEGKHTQAIENYQRAAILDPNFLDVYYHMGLVHQRQKNFDNAILNYKLVLEQGSKTPLPYSALGFTYYEQGNKNEAEKNFNEGISNYPLSPFGTYNYAVYKLGLGEIEESGSFFEKAVMCLDEPEWSKLQLKGNLHEQTLELKKITESISKTELNSQQINLNYLGLTDGLKVQRESETEILSNLEILNKRIINLGIEVNKRIKLDNDIVNIQDKNPQLHDYIIDFLCFQTNFLRSIGLELPKKTICLATVNILRKARDCPNLMLYTSGELAAELIKIATDNPMKNSEMLEKTRVSILIQKNSFDSNEILYKLASIVVRKTQSSNEKELEIKNYESNETQNEIIGKINKALPKVKSDIANAATSIAIKDFVLLNNYLILNSQASDFANKTYEQNFERAYETDIYAKKSEQNLATNANTFESFKERRGEGKFEILITFDNKNKAVSNSQFYIQSFLAFADSIEELKRRQPNQLREIYKSNKTELKTNNTFNFSFEKSFLSGQSIDKAYLKVAVFKQKSGNTIKTKGINWVSLSTITNKSTKLMQMSQKKMFSSKVIHIFIQGRSID